MQTNTRSFSKITIDSANRKGTRLPLSHDVNTTASIGDVQPLLCRQLLPKSSTTLKTRHLIRLLPMVAPTMARLKANCWNHFVGLSDLLPRSFPAMLAKAPIARASTSSLPSVPTLMPHSIICDISAACLVGASFTVYFHEPSGTELPDASLTNWRGYQFTSTATCVTDFLAWIASHMSFGANNGFVGYNGANLQLEALGPQFGTSGNSGYIPINCSGSDSLNTSGSQAVRRFFFPTSSTSADSSWEPVSLNSANYVFRTQFTQNGNTYNIAFAVRLSAFGKRIRKILTALGIKPNFSVASTPTDITPLFAFYKAYWDTFGLTLYDNWESSAANVLLSAWDAQEDSSPIGWNTQFFKRFIYDLGTVFVTEAQDYISAHQHNDVVGTGSWNPGEQDKKRGFVNNIILDPPGFSNGISAVAQNAYSDAVGYPDKTGHVFINRINHTEVDAELLKTLYKWTNRQTIAGKRIKELLEAGGYGQYVKECKTNFIGYQELDIDISDINATADSTNAVTGKNSDLGNVVGKGVGVSQGDARSMHYENDELGYWVTLFAIVPESGWCQGFDPINLDIDADHKYNPDFDGLGMELEPKLIVQGDSDWCNSSYDSDFMASFGSIPRHTKYKVAHNILNGDFSLRGVRDLFLPYILDRYVSFGDRECELIDSANLKYAVQSGSPISSIPVAGNAWRYLNRYQWLANFERIFAADETNSQLWLKYVLDMSNLTNYELYYNVADHFICMNMLDLQCYARVLPVSDSYGTTDENNGNGDTTFSKA